MIQYLSQICHIIIDRSQNICHGDKYLVFLATILVKVGFYNLKLISPNIPKYPNFVLIPISPLKCCWFVLSDLE